MKKCIVITYNNSGQTLVSLLFFMIVAITITSASVIVLLVNSLSTNSFQQGNIALDIAQSGIENAMVRLLRNTNYTGETLTVGSGTATVTVTGANPKIILSQGKVDNFLRQIQVQATNTNNIFTITSWKEIY